MKSSPRSSCRGCGRERAGVSVSSIGPAPPPFAGLRVAVTGAAAAPYALPDHAVAGLLGALPSDTWADAVADQLAAAADPVTDHYASAAYRLRIVRHLVRQAVADA